MRRECNYPFAIPDDEAGAVDAASALLHGDLAVEKPIHLEEDRTRLDTVIQFADNVLKNGRDRYHLNPTPQFADGINVTNGEHVRWRSPGARPEVISDLVCQVHYAAAFLFGLAEMPVEDISFSDISVAMLPGTEAEYSDMADDLELMQRMGFIASRYPTQPVIASEAQQSQRCEKEATMN